MPLDLSDVVIDADLAEAFQIIRSSGQFVPGGWADSKFDIAAFGVVSIARPKDIEMLPEGDHVSEAIVIHTNQAIYVTRDNDQEGTGTSDVLVWNGFKYRVLVSAVYSNRGYWRAIAARTTGA